MAGIVTISEDLAPVFYVDNTTVGTSEVQVIPQALKILKGVQLKALSANSGIIYISNEGGASTSTGFPLSAGEGIFIPIKNVTKIRAISDTVSQSLRWLAI